MCHGGKKLAENDSIRRLGLGTQDITTKTLEPGLGTGGSEAPGCFPQAVFSWPGSGVLPSWVRMHWNWVSLSFLPRDFKPLWVFCPHIALWRREEDGAHDHMTQCQMF